MADWKAILLVGATLFGVVAICGVNSSRQPERIADELKRVNLRE